MRISAFQTDDTNNRRIRGGRATVHVVRQPSNLIIAYRSRQDRRRGQLHTVSILQTGLCRVRRRHVTGRHKSLHHSRVNSKSHDRGVHACGFPRSHLASRHVKLAIRDLGLIVSKSVRRVVSTLIRRGRTHRLTRRTTATNKG